MPINTLATATLFQNTLDKVAIQDAVTGWMDANAGQVLYNGGAEVKIPKMSVQGMGDYDRDEGYAQGGITEDQRDELMASARERRILLTAMRHCRTRWTNSFLISPKWGKLSLRSPTV